MLKISDQQMMLFSQKARLQNEAKVRAAIDSVEDVNDVDPASAEARALATSRAVAWAPDLKLDDISDYAKLGMLALIVGKHWDGLRASPLVAESVETPWLTGTERLDQIVEIAQDALFPEAGTEGQV
jgi:hypothetical protein